MSMDTSDVQSMSPTSSTGGLGGGDFGLDSQALTELIQREKTTQKTHKANVTKLRSDLEQFKHTIGDKVFQVFCEWWKYLPKEHPKGNIPTRAVTQRVKKEHFKNFCYSILSLLDAAEDGPVLVQEAWDKHKVWKSSPYIIVRTEFLFMTGWVLQQVFEDDNLQASMSDTAIRKLSLGLLDSLIRNELLPPRTKITNTKLLFGGAPPSRLMHKIENLRRGRIAQEEGKDSDEPLSPSLSTTYTPLWMDANDAEVLKPKPKPKPKAKTFNIGSYKFTAAGSHLKVQQSSKLRTAMRASTRPPSASRRRSSTPLFKKKLRRGSTASKTTKKSKQKKESSSEEESSSDESEDDEDTGTDDEDESSNDSEHQDNKTGSTLPVPTLTIESDDDQTEDIELSIPIANVDSVDIRGVVLRTYQLLRKGENAKTILADVDAFVRRSMPSTENEHETVEPVTCESYQSLTFPKTDRTQHPRIPTATLYDDDQFVPEQWEASAASFSRLREVVIGEAAVSPVKQNRITDNVQLPFDVSASTNHHGSDSHLPPPLPCPPSADDTTERKGAVCSAMIVAKWLQPNNAAYQLADAKLISQAPHRNDPQLQFTSTVNSFPTMSPRGGSGGLSSSLNTSLSLSNPTNSRPFSAAPTSLQNLYSNRPSSAYNDNASRAASAPPSHVCRYRKLTRYTKPDQNTETSKNTDNHVKPPPLLLNLPSSKKTTKQQNKADEVVWQRLPHWTSFSTYGFKQHDATHKLSPSQSVARKQAGKNPHATKALITPKPRKAILSHTTFSGPIAATIGAGESFQGSMPMSLNSSANSSLGLGRTVPPSIAKLLKDLDLQSSEFGAV